MNESSIFTSTSVWSEKSLNESSISSSYSVHVLVEESLNESATWVSTVVFPIRMSPVEIVVSVFDTEASSPAAAPQSPVLTTAPLAKPWVTFPPALIAWLTDWSTCVARLSISRCSEPAAAAAAPAPARPPTWRSPKPVLYWRTPTVTESSSRFVELSMSMSVSL